MAQPVVHFEVVGRDGAALQSFYGQLFDWSIDADNPMAYGMVEAAEGGIAGGVAQGEAPSAVFYVQVDDPAAYLARAEQLGGKTVIPDAAHPRDGHLRSVRRPRGQRGGHRRGGDPAGRVVTRGRGALSRVTSRSLYARYGAHDGLRGGGRAGE